MFFCFYSDACGRRGIAGLEIIKKIARIPVDVQQQLINFVVDQAKVLGRELTPEEANELLLALKAQQKI